MLLGAGCGPDLPEGWEDARPVDTLTQTECLGIDPYEEHDERVEGDISSSPLEVSLREGHFRCEQEVEGFYKVDGSEVDVLLQPVRMNPKSVAKCDCLYDIDITLSLEVDLAPEALTLYRRWDNLNEPNDPVEIGTLTRD
jgi:hypothetical protein